MWFITSGAEMWAQWIIVLEYPVCIGYDISPANEDFMIYLNAFVFDVGI
jgi:hypothetical protein